jgi:hypothetical protein
LHESSTLSIPLDAIMHRIDRFAPTPRAPSALENTA